MRTANTADMETNMTSNVLTYNCYPGSGWHKFGRLVVNFHNYRVVSVFLGGVQIFEAAS